VWTACAALGVGASARAETLDHDGLMAEARKNKALARYIKVHGMPDLAERVAITDEPPWDDHQVVVSYFDNRKELSFARARVLGAPTVHTRRYVRMLTDADVRRLRGQVGRAEASTTPCGSECGKKPGCCEHHPAK
jgi:hypothetical protein